MTYISLRKVMNLKVEDLAEIENPASAKSGRFETVLVIR
jgi:hypothetical protein